MKNKHDMLLARRIIHAMSTSLVIAFSLACFVRVALADGWSRNMVDMGTRPVGEYVFEPFELIAVSGQDDHVSGYCVFTNIKASRVTVDGTETPDGEFHPSVTLQASNDQRSGWEFVRVSTPHGKNSKLNVEPNSHSKTLIVDLDALRSVINKFKYGKITLKTGETITFELANLLPP